MFQIFAARMFEQRVLTAYREKVAKERQQKLIEEIDDESRLEAQRKAKKAKEAQKRKDKAARKKEAQAEEKARREAEKAAEEAARIAEETRKVEEQRQRAEEKKKKKEAAKKAEEEDRLRKEAERQRRVHEQKEKQAELERKIRESKEREKKAKDEARQKEKDAREQKEREAREKKERQEQEKREKEARVRSEREAREKHRQEARAATKAAALVTGPPITLAKRPAAHAVPTAVPALPQQPPVTFSSPQIPVATPAIPKAPTPMRQRQPSQQESVSASSQATTQPGSAASQNASPLPLTPVHTSPGPIGPPSKTSSTGPPSIPQPLPQATSPLAGAAKMVHHPGVFNIPPPMGMPFPPGLSGVPPGFGNPPFQPNMGGFRPGPGMMPMPPGLNGPVGGRGFPGHPPPGFSQPMDSSPLVGMAPVFPPGLSKDNGSSHSRQPSAGYEPGTPGQSSQPISRPAPIGRPPSVVHGQRAASGTNGFPAGLAKPELEEHLGSSALLDDSDDPLQDFPSMRRGAVPRQGPAFPVGPFGHEPLFASAVNPWVPAGSATANPFGAAPAPPPGFGGHPHPGALPWGPPAGGSSGFGAQGPIGRPSQPRSVAVRLMLCRACEEATAEGATTEDGFVPLETIKGKVDMFLKGDIPDEELLILCDTEGNDNNGGGSFDTRTDSSSNTQVRWVSTTGPGVQPFLHRAVGAPGEIGSPKPDRHAGMFGTSR